MVISFPVALRAPKYEPSFRINNFGQFDFMIFIIPQNGNLCWLPGNCSQSSYSLPVKKGALPIEIKIIMSISCASTQMLLLNGFLQGWLLDGQMCEWYPPPSSTEMVWDFCRSPLCQTEPQQISPIHHHQHFTGL